MDVAPWFYKGTPPAKIMFSFVSPQFGQLGPLFSDNVLCVWRNKVPMVVEIMMVIMVMTMMKKITKKSQEVGDVPGWVSTSISWTVLVMLREVHCKNIARGTTDSGNGAKMNTIDNSSYKLHTLVPLCLWQCFYNFGNIYRFSSFIFSLKILTILTY